jgi:hypothetical protein
VVSVGYDFKPSGGCVPGVLLPSTELPSVFIKNTHVPFISSVFIFGAFNK